mgnify:CR=1 FL=1
MKITPTTLPRRIGRWVQSRKRFEAWYGRNLDKGRRIRTDSIRGFLMLWTVSSLRPMRRRLLRDALGLTGLKRVLGLFLMDIGAMHYTVSGDVRWRPRAQRGLTVYLRNGLRNLGPMVLSQLALFALLWACGAAWVYWAWPLAYLTSFSVFLRIRALAEHACLPGGSEIFANTRTTRAGWLARCCVAPLNVNFHQEHHLMASVPYHRLVNY